MKKIKVSTNNGKRITLTSDDTYTLAFPKMKESTPETLRAIVSEKSLRRISNSDDQNNASKAKKALSFRIQKSYHGCGVVSVQVFDCNEKLKCDYTFR